MEVGQKGDGQSHKSIYVRTKPLRPDIIDVEFRSTNSQLIVQMHSIHNLELDPHGARLYDFNAEIKLTLPNHGTSCLRVCEWLGSSYYCRKAETFPGPVYFRSFRSRLVVDLLRILNSLCVNGFPWIPMYCYRIFTFS